MSSGWCCELKPLSTTRFKRMEGRGQSGTSSPGCNLRLTSVRAHEFSDRQMVAREVMRFDEAFDTEKGWLMGLLYKLPHITRQAHEELIERFGIFKRKLRSFYRRYIHAAEQDKIGIIRYNEQLRRQLIRAEDCINRLNWETSSVTSNWKSLTKEQNQQYTGLMHAYESLQNSHAQLVTNEEILQRQILSLESQMASEGNKSGSYLDSSATPLLLENVLRGLRIDLRNFTKPFVNARGNLCPSNHANFLDIHFSRPSHIKFGHEAYVSSVIFSSIEREDFGVENQQVKLLPLNQLQAEFFQEFEAFMNSTSENVESVPVKYREAFETFCSQKWVTFYGQELDMAKIQESCKQSSRGNEQTTDLDSELQATFFQLSKSVWMLHKLIHSFDPSARVIRVGRGAKFNGEYMRNVAEESTGNNEGQEDVGNPTVALVILPGFSVRKCMLKSLVYVHAHNL